MLRVCRYRYVHTLKSTDTSSSSAENSLCTAQLLHDEFAVLCEPCALLLPATNLEHSPHTTWIVCSPTRKLCCPSVTKSYGCQCLGEHIWACFFMVLCHISSMTSCWKSLLELMKINLFMLVLHSCVSLEILCSVLFPAAFVPRLFECGEGGCYLSGGTDPVPQ